jgi:hypothetical protein
MVALHPTVLSAAGAVSGATWPAASGTGRRAMPKEPTSPRDEPVARARAWRRDLAGVYSCGIMEVAEGGHVYSGTSAGNT